LVEPDPWRFSCAEFAIPGAAMGAKEGFRIFMEGEFVRGGKRNSLASNRPATLRRGDFSNHRLFSVLTTFSIVRKGRAIGARERKPSIYWGF
jgi:hypothetical protein